MRDWLDIFAALRDRALSRACSRTLPALAALTLAVVPGCRIEQGEPPGGVRNVVLVSLDAVGAKHVGAYGYGRDTTPRFDREAARGVLFEDATANQVWTLTSHITMLTGLYPQAHGASEERAAAPGATSLTAILRAAGFATAAFVGIGGYMDPQFGLGQGFELYAIGDGDTALDNRARAQWLARQAALRSEDPNHRFFLFAHYYDAHSDRTTSVPYYAPEPFGLYFLGGRLDWDRGGDTALLSELAKDGPVSERDREVVTALYDGGVRYTDQRGLAPLLDALDAAGFGDDTLVVITSDHGEEIYEHGKPSHQQPYVETSRVPLLIRGPGVAEGRRVTQPVELVDLMPTVLSLVGLPTPSHVPGWDLSPWLREASSLPPDAPRDVYVDGILGGIPHEVWRYSSSVVGAVEGERYRYVDRVRYRLGDAHTRFDTDGVGELYRLRDDPDEQTDVARREPGVAADLRGRLLAWYERNDALVRTLRRDAAAAPRPRLDDEERRRLEALGYVR